jgi:hypothetical protein
MVRKIFKLASGVFFILLMASCVYAADITLSWDPSENGGEAGGYMVEWSTSSGGESDVNGVNAELQTSTTISGLDETKEYFFIVYAYNAAGRSAASNEISWPDPGNSSNDNSSDDEGGGGGGCFIATAAYGSLFEPHVKILRNFRDSCLMPTSIGRWFVNLYYEYSPALAHVIAKHDSMRAVVRWGLEPVVGIAYMALNTSMMQKIGIVVVAMMVITGCFVYVRRRFRVLGSGFTVESARRVGGKEGAKV